MEETPKQMSLPEGEAPMSQLPEDLASWPSPETQVSSRGVEDVKAASEFARLMGMNNLKEQVYHAYEAANGGKPDWAKISYETTKKIGEYFDCGFTKVIGAFKSWVMLDNPKGDVIAFLKVDFEGTVQPASIAKELTAPKSQAEKPPTVKEASSAKTPESAPPDKYQELLQAWKDRYNEMAQKDKEKAITVILEDIMKKLISKGSIKEGDTKKIISKEVSEEMESRLRGFFKTAGASDREIDTILEQPISSQEPEFVPMEKVVEGQIPVEELSEEKPKDTYSAIEEKYTNKYSQMNDEDMEAAAIDLKAYIDSQISKYPESDRTSFTEKILDAFLDTLAVPEGERDYARSRIQGYLGS